MKLIAPLRPPTASSRSWTCWASLLTIFHSRLSIRPTSFSSDFISGCDVMWCVLRPARPTVRRQPGKTRWSGWGARCRGRQRSRTRPSSSTCLHQASAPAARDSPWRRGLTRRLRPAPWNPTRWWETELFGVSSLFPSGCVMKLKVQCVKLGSIYEFILAKAEHAARKYMIQSV